MKDFRQSPEPKLSSTIILLKEGDGTEILMVERHYQIDFASGAFVFPGGKASDDDFLDNWNGRVDGDFEGNDKIARIAGVREVFEESGLLLARHKSQPHGEFTGQDMVEKLAPHRHAVDRGEMSFLELIAENDLVLDLSRLLPFAHWITPHMMPKRFDTLFYVARAPSGQVAVHDGRETTQAIWIKPSEILRRERNDDAILLFPTRVNIERLEDLESVTAIEDYCRSTDIVTVLPVVENRDDGNVLVISPEAGYRVTEEPLEKVSRTVGGPK